MLGEAVRSASIESLLLGLPEHSNEASTQLRYCRKVAIFAISGNQILCDVVRIALV